MVSLTVLIFLSLLSTSEASSKFVVLKHTEVNSFHKKVSKNEWQPIEVNFKKSREVPLLAGTYHYDLRIKNSVGSFEGTFDINEKETVYLHRAVTDDRKYVHAWASIAKPRSPQYQIEKLEKFCSAINFKEFKDYTLEACKKLYTTKNAIGLLGMEEAYYEGHEGDVDPR